MYWFSIFLLRVYEVPGTIVSAEIYLWTKQTRFPSHSVNILERRGRQWMNEWVSEWGLCKQGPIACWGSIHFLLEESEESWYLSEEFQTPVIVFILSSWRALFEVRELAEQHSALQSPFPSAIKTQTQWFESSARYPRLKVLREDGLTPRPHALPCESCTLN